MSNQKKFPWRTKTLQRPKTWADNLGMTDNFAIRQEIIDRLGCPEPELPGVQFIGSSSGPSFELLAMFDEMCMHDMNDRKQLERAIAKLEQVRARDFQAFYLGRSELLSMYPVVHEVPTGPTTRTDKPARRSARG